MVKSTILFVTSVIWTIIIKVFIWMILFNSRLFNTGRFINNTLFLWYITADSRYFTRFDFLCIAPWTLCFANTKNLWCNSTCKKKNLVQGSQYFWCHKWLLPSLVSFLFQKNSSPPTEPFLLLKSVYSVPNKYRVKSI